MSLARSFASVKPHVPLIRFRKGSLIPKSTPPQPIETEALPKMPKLTQTSTRFVFLHTKFVNFLILGNLGVAASSVSLEWYETPAKYKRPLIDEAECEAINNGGMEKTWT